MGNVFNSDESEQVVLIYEIKMMELKTIVLGAEYDNDLIQKLKQVLINKGGNISEKMKGIGGSQELVQYEVMIDGVELMIEIETYIGVSVTGPDSIVDEIANSLSHC